MNIPLLVSERSACVPSTPRVLREAPIRPIGARVRMEAAYGRAHCCAEGYNRAGRDTSNFAACVRFPSGASRTAKRALRLATVLAALCLPTTAASMQGPFLSTGSAPSSPTSSVRDLRLLAVESPSHRAVQGAQHPSSLQHSRRTEKCTGLRRAVSFRSGLSSADDRTVDLIPVVRSSGRRQDWEYRARGDPDSRIYTRLQTGLYQSEIDW